MFPTNDPSWYTQITTTTEKHKVCTRVCGREARGELILGGEWGDQGWRRNFHASLLIWVCVDLINSTETRVRAGAEIFALERTSHISIRYRSV